MKHKQWLFHSFALSCCLLALAGCGDEVAETGIDDNTPVELRVSPTVATLTRSAIQGGTQSGSAATVMQNVAVYAEGADYTDAKSNNYAVYNQSSGTWTNGGTPKIYLTNVAATIYAYYPTTTKYDATGIPVSLQATGTIAAPADATVATASSEVDCMWANSMSGVTNKANNNVTLTMKHALSMVSFRVYKENYSGTGSLTEIKLENAGGGGTTMSKGTNPKMNIKTGAITEGTPVATTYTRTISGYTLGTVKDDAKKLGILVLPIGSSIGSDKIVAKFKVDNADYSVNLTAPVASSGLWKAGENYLYSVKLKGTELSITSVTVTAWNEVAGGDLVIQ